MASKRGTSAADTLLGGAGNDVLLGLAGNDVLIGGSGNDRLDGGAGNDRLVGGDGNDVLIGGAGADRMRGDSGNDHYVLDGAAELDKSITDTGLDTVEVRFNYTLGAQQENLVLGASSALNGTGNSSANSLTGNTGNNRLDGGAGNDILIGGGGSDTLLGGAGADRLRGDAGNDTYVIDRADEINKSVSDAGFDTVFSSVSYSLGAAQEALTLTGNASISATGNAGNNILIGNDGNNRLDGGAGVDSLRGGAGDDTYVIDSVDEIDKNLGDAGFDTVLSSISYTLGAAQEALTLTGNASISATGNDGDNLLIGNDGNNLLDGGPGLDVLYGGGGDDILVSDSSIQFVDGGSGLDTFRFTGSGVRVELMLNELHNVEVVDIRGSGSNSLDLRSFAFTSDGLTLLSGNNALRVRHDADDAVSIMIDFALNGGRWTAAADRVIDGITYDHYTRIDSIATLDVESVAGILPLTSLNGPDGFRLFDVGLGGRHHLTTAGDVNGDGYADLALGSAFADHNGSGSGSAFIAFGRAMSDPILLVNSFDGSDGFRVDGAAELDQLGSRVSAAGDINGDGYGDVLFGATGRATNGAAALVLGAANGFAAHATVDSLAPAQATDFSVSGLAQIDIMQVGAAGDVNGDGFDDIVFGAYSVDVTGERSGAAYVVFGAADGLPANVDLDTLDGNNGVRVVGISYAGLGYSLDSAGDINGDGVDDLLLGEYGDGPRGSAYVVFGSSTGFTAQFNLANLDGSNGFRLRGSFDSHDFGDSVSAAGDINGDGFDDLVVSDHVSRNAYVLFGSAQAFAANIDAEAFDGIRGAVITGGGILAVGGAGDINGDGYDDLLLGNAKASPHASYSGSSYVVYGSADGPGASLDLRSADSNRVLRLDGEGTQVYSGQSVEAAGDINGDGLADILIGLNPLFLGYAQSVGGYVIYGDTRSADSAQRGDSGDNTLTGTTGAESLLGGEGNDVLNGAGGADVLYGGAGDDVLVWDADDRRLAGGGGEDELRVDGAGVAIDLTAVANNHMTGIERIALTGSGDNSLTLDIRDVLALPDHADQFLAHHTRQLLIDGDAGDVVHAGAQNWVQGANVDIGGKTYASYTQANIAAELLIDIAVTRDIS